MGGQLQSVDLRDLQLGVGHAFAGEAFGKFLADERGVAAVVVGDDLAPWSDDAGQQFAVITDRKSVV